MSRLETLKRHLKRGQVYRRHDLTNWSKSVDRDLDLLLEDGTFQKLSQGLYHYPEKTVFGLVPPDDNVLVSSFLRDKRFLVTSPNSYNGLGVGTTQLYNIKTVYNHKRHGEFTFGSKTFDFKIKPHFPKKVTEEFLVVDLVNNLDSLAEDKGEILQNVSKKVSTMDSSKLAKSVEEYGDVKTQKLFSGFLSKSQVYAA